ncbi:MAG: nucleoside phosphorylase [Candidatus Aminicenantes bacterium]
MEDESIIKPKPLRGFKRKKVIYIPCDAPDQFIRKFFQKNILKEKTLGYGQFILLKDRTILYQCLGAPAAVLCLEPLISSGAEEILILGFCGSLNPERRMLEAAVITQARSEEGTSKHYFSKRKTFYASPRLKNRLKTELTRRGLFFHQGSTVSTDAPYRETKPWLVEKQEKKIDFVDMECSAVFALAEFHHIQAAALMIISDELSAGRWKQSFRLLGLRKKIMQYFFPFIKEKE